MTTGRDGVGWLRSTEKPLKDGLNRGDTGREGGHSQSTGSTSHVPFETAESPQGDVAAVDMGRPMPAARAVPKSKVRKGDPLPAMLMEKIASLANLLLAFKRVASNQGAPGPDRQSVDHVREHLPRLLPHLQQALMAGSYVPGMIRRVWIPKSSGGKRGLGIPNVVDRVVQQAVYQVLSPYYEPDFHPSSHGFRPGRSCHTAIEEARKYVEAGRRWVVDIDLECFFDRVNHQRLLARLSERIQDSRVLDLILRMLKAKVVLPDGVVVSTDEGTPQGGPLSPLLSNIVLDELDWELARRGHCFVRYADDSNIYVWSERAGKRVMASLAQFIEKRLRLRVNAAKSAVALPENRHFLGFSLCEAPLAETVSIMPSDRTRRRVYEKVRELTPRNWGRSLKDCIESLNQYLTGWLGFFWICSPRSRGFFHNLEGHIRRRLRAIVLRQRKRSRNVVRFLVSHGVPPRQARQVYTRRGIWAQTTLVGVQRGLKNKRFAELGLLALYKEWIARRETAASSQMQLDLAWDS